MKVSVPGSQSFRYKRLLLTSNIEKSVLKLTFNRSIILSIKLLATFPVCDGKRIYAQLDQLRQRLCLSLSHGYFHDYNSRAKKFMRLIFWMTFHFEFAESRHTTTKPLQLLYASV